MWPNLLSFPSSVNSKDLTSSASTLERKDVATTQHRNWLIFLFFLLIVRSALLISVPLIFAALIPGAAMAAPEDPLQPYVDERDAIILGFRMSGQLDQPRLGNLEQALLTVSNGSSGAI